MANLLSNLITAKLELETEYEKKFQDLKEKENDGKASSALGSLGLKPKPAV